MRWETLVPFLIPLATAYVAFRNTGIRRLIAIVATLAATGCYLLPLQTDYFLSLRPDLDPFVLTTTNLALFAVGLIAILALLAGDLWHPAQWVAVGIGTLAMATSFVAFWLVLANLDCRHLNIELMLSGKSGELGTCISAELITAEIAAALLPFGSGMILAGPKAIDAFFKAREERARPGAARRRWHSSQWLAVGIGALLMAGTLVLVYMRSIDKDLAVILLTTEVLVIALAPHIVGWLLRVRETQSGQVET